MTDVSVVIAVYNAEQYIAELVAELRSELLDCTSAYEIILVDDSSPDGSWSVIESIAERCRDVVAVRMARNSGQHNALLCGIRMSSHAVVITMDDDFQHPPAEIPRLLAEIGRGSDLVYGCPQQDRHRAWRRSAARIVKGVMSTARVLPHAREITSFRAFRSELRSAFVGEQGPFLSLDAVLIGATSRCSTVRVRHEPRRAGRSNYTVAKLVNHTLNMVFGYSFAPLRALWVLGVGFVALGSVALVIGAVVLVLGSGKTALSSVVVPFLVILTGLQLVAVGVLGEYLARMHADLRGGPGYLVSATVDRRSEPS